MNKRIKELAEQIGFDLYSDDKEQDIQDFAELIVRECCQFEKSYGGDAGLVARSFSRKIKEHFGVDK